MAQTRVSELLQGIVNTGRVSNGYIFSGPERCGKTTAAKAFFKALTGVEVEHAVDFYKIKSETSTIGVETMKDVKYFVQYGPRQQSHLIVLIENADQFSLPAANGFLKLLEEPPPQVVFILETSRPDALLKTIMSRCQKIVFDQLPAEVMAELMPEKLSEERLLLAGGLLGYAEKIQQEPEKVDRLIAMVDLIKQKTYTDIIQYVETLGKDKEEISLFLNVLVQYLKNRQALALAKIVLEYLKILQKNVNLKLTLEVMFMKLREV